jgi:hypothetical protein
VGLNWHVDKFAILHQLHHPEKVHTSTARPTCKTLINRFLLPVPLKVGIVQVLNVEQIASVVSAFLLEIFDLGGGHEAEGIVIEQLLYVDGTDRARRTGWLPWRRGTCQVNDVL